MIPNLKIRLKHSKPPDMVRAAFRAACKAAFAAMGRYWIEHFLARHFTAQAKHTYNHRPRSKKWNERKLRQTGQAIDSVFTGRMKEALLRSNAIRSFPTRVRISLFGPDYMKINFRKTTNQPNKKKEIATITKGELRELLKVWKQVFLREYDKYKRSRTTQLV